VPESYIRALRFRALTRFYDPLLAIVLREANWKGRLVEQVALRPEMRALDLGCGTGTLTVALARSRPAATVVGLDPDPDILVRARTKAAAAAVAVEFVEGLAETPPFPSRSFDRVVSSLMFHHLTTEVKRRALAAARNLLRDGGELHVADWGEPHDWLMRVAFVPVQLLDGFEATSDNVRGDVPRLIAEAGFADVEETHRERTALGTLVLIRAVAAGPRS
jgi:ubiquinone/menaquinone biosynthesis C-methylase UbiE